MVEFLIGARGMWAILRVCEALVSKAQGGINRERLLLQ